MAYFARFFKDKAYRPWLEALDVKQAQDLGSGQACLFSMPVQMQI